MTPPALPAVVTRLIRLVVPRERVEPIVADLADDYARLAAARGRLPRAWLARETISLLIAYAGVPADRVRRLLPLFLRDLQFAWRNLRRAPLATAGAAAMLATGLVALLITTGLSNALLFRRVSAAHGDALRRIVTLDQRGLPSSRFSYRELQRLGDSLGGVGTVGAVTLQPVVMRVAGADTQTMVEVVDGRYFPLTGLPIRIGRGLMSADDRAGAEPVAVLSAPFWRDRFGASPDALGRTIQLNGAAYTIVGVSAALGSSSFLGASVDAWIPIGQADPVLNRGFRTAVTERLFTAYVLPAGSLAAVDVRLQDATAAFAREGGPHWTNRRLATDAATVLAGSQRANARWLAALLFTFSALIVLASASNLGGVFLARAAATRRQIAVHLALGSGRAAVVRRTLAEGAGVGLCAALLALAGYQWARALLAEVVLLPTLALRLDLPMDATLIALVAACGVASGVVLAAGPAVWAARVQLADAMPDGDRRVSGGRRLAHARRLLVAAQIALSLTLVVGAALFARTLSALTRADLGFPRDHLVAMDFDLEPASPPASALPGLAREALRRAAALPDVRSAAMSNRAPVDQSTPTVDVRTTAGGSVDLGGISMNLATPEYFETVGIPLVAGRAFTAEEADSRAPVVILNQAGASMLWPQGGALDRVMYLDDSAAPHRVVGIARGAKYRSITETSRPHVYRPTPPALGLTLLVRTSGDPRAALRALQRELDAVGPGLVGFFPRTLDEHLAIELLPARAAAGAAGILGAVALLLSAVGLFGLVSWFVALRRREIGVRVALGATARDIRRLVVGEALRAAWPGTVAGVLLASLLGLVARSALYGVGPIDPIAFGVGAAALAVIVLTASLLPVRRALRLDPSEVLRSE
jgi:predicted permease